MGFHTEYFTCNHEPKFSFKCWMAMILEEIKNQANQNIFTY